MHLRLHRVLPLIVTVGLFTLGSSPVGAQSAPTLTVTPQTGLISGQLVTVVGTDFDTGPSGVFVGECPAGTAARFPTDFSAINSCAFPMPGILIGSFTTTIPVTSTYRALDGTTHTCSATQPCVVLAFVPVTALEVPITFARTPATKDECRHDGWRQLVDDQGQAFPNQGQCISFVNHSSS
jgi:hypothetical protein